MMRQLIILVLAISAGSVMAQSQVYKTTDEHGNVVFTDQPSDAAEEVPVQAPQTFPAKDLAREYSQFELTEKPPKADNTPPYESLEITSPADDEAIRSNNGNIEITIAMVPELTPGHLLELRMDGQKIRDLFGAGPIALENVDRGTHIVQLQVIDAGSLAEVQSSKPVSFHVLRVSI